MRPQDIPPSIGAFSSKVKSATNRGSKEIVLSLPEAVDLTTSLNQLLLKQNALLQDIVELQRQLIEGPRVVQLDGGGFDSKD